MKRETLCSLEHDIAKFVNPFKGTLMYRSGVWNKYQERTKEDVIRNVKASSYGADVDIDRATNTMYVSQPCASDMW